MPKVKMRRVKTAHIEIAPQGGQFTVVCAPCGFHHRMPYHLNGMDATWRDLLEEKRKVKGVAKAMRNIHNQFHHGSKKHTYRTF